MTQEVSSTIQAIAGLFGVLLSIAALIIAIRVEKRTEKRFKEEQQITEKIAIANIRPIIDVFSTTYTDKKSVILTNYGMGTAIITDISFSKNGKTVRNVAKLIELPREVSWDTYYGFSSQRPHNIKSGDERTLAKLTLEHLTVQGIDRQEALSLLECMEREKSGIRVHIVYKDVLDNEQPVYERVL